MTAPSPRPGAPSPWSWVTTWLALNAMLLVAPIFQAYASNTHAQGPAVMGRSLAAAALVLLALAGAVRGFRGDPARWGALGMATTLGTLFPFFAKQLARVLLGFGLPGRFASILAFAFVVVGVVALLGLTLTPRHPTLLRIRGLATALTLWVFLVSVTETGWRLSTTVTEPFPGRPIPAGTRVPDTRPDFFHIVLDGLPAPALQRELFGVDPDPVLAEFEAAGFRTTRRARSPYAFTAATMASILRADRIPANALELVEASNNIRPLATTIERAPVFQVFRRAGYRVVVIASGGPLFDHMEADELHRPFPSEFENLLVSSSLPGMLAPGWQFHRRRLAQEEAFAQLERVAREPGPLLVFCHILAPHPPAVIDAQGAPIETPGGYRIGPFFELGVEACRRRLAGQIEWAQQRTLRAVRAILDRPDRQAGFLIHGDHGPKFFYGGEDEALRCRSSFESFYVERLPGVPESVGPERGMVNAYLPVLSAWFGIDLAPLPLRSRFSIWTDPYRMKDCPTGER